MAFKNIKFYLFKIKILFFNIFYSAIYSEVDEIICFYEKNIINNIRCFEDGRILMENKKPASQNSLIILQK
jgi:hypothetical protein